MYNMFQDGGTIQSLMGGMGAAPQAQGQDPYFMFSPEYQQMRPLVEAMRGAPSMGMGGMGGGGGAAAAAGKMTPFDMASLGMMGAGSVLDFIGGIMQTKAAKKEGKKNRSLARDQMAAQTNTNNAQLFQNLYQLLLQGRQGVR